MNQYQVSIVDAIKRAFSNYCVFTGRASRSEYWWFCLFVAIVCYVFAIPGGILNANAILNGEEPSSNIFSIISCIWSLAVLLPTMGLAFRRLHDTGRSGWNICWGFLPLIGAVILIIYFCQPSQPVENKYGPVPNVR